MNLGVTDMPMTLNHWECWDPLKKRVWKVNEEYYRVLKNLA